MKKPDFAGRALRFAKECIAFTNPFHKERQGLQPLDVMYFFNVTLPAGS
jgi:hypothetical protein